MALKTHFYIKRILNKLIDWIFIQCYGLYTLFYKWRLSKVQYAVNHEENEEYSTSVRLSNELDLQYEHIKNSLKPGHFSALPVQNVNVIINRKNMLKEWFTTGISIIIHVYFIIFCYEYFTHHDQTTTNMVNIIVNDTIEETPKKNDIFWYHVNLNMRKYDDFNTMKQQYADVLSQPCIPLTRKETSNNFIQQCGVNDVHVDLTLLYHMMCHLASERTIENNNINIIIPKFLNVTNLRRLNDEFPIGLFQQDNDHIEYIESYQVPNICVMAISLPSEHVNLDHKHFPIEQSIDPNIPEGAFIHTSIRHLNDDNSTLYDLNPSIEKKMNETWKSVPTVGECSILINPEFVQLSPGNYTLRHSHVLLRDKTEFKTMIYNDVEIKFNDIDFSHRHWKPKTQKHNMYVQTALDVLNSRTCWWD